MPTFRITYTLARAQCSNTDPKLGFQVKRVVEDQASEAPLSTVTQPALEAALETHSASQVPWSEWFKKLLLLSRSNQPAKDKPAPLHSVHTSKVKEGESGVDDDLR